MNSKYSFVWIFKNEWHIVEATHYVCHVNTEPLNTDMNGRCNVCVPVFIHRCRMGTPFPSSQRRVPVSHQLKLSGGSVWPVPPGRRLVPKLRGVSRLWGHQRWTHCPHHTQVQVRWVPGDMTTCQCSTLTGLKSGDEREGSFQSLWFTGMCPTVN